MESNNAVNSSQLREQMITAIPNEVHTVISADHGRPTDIPVVTAADQTGTSAEDTTPSTSGWGLAALVAGMLVVLVVALGLTSGSRPAARP